MERLENCSSWFSGKYLSGFRKIYKNYKVLHSLLNYTELALGHTIVILSQMSQHNGYQRVALCSLIELSLDWVRPLYILQQKFRDLETCPDIIPTVHDQQ